MVAAGPAPADEPPPEATPGDLTQVERDLEESRGLQTELDVQAGMLDREVSELRAEMITVSLGIMAQHEILLEVEREMAVLEADEAERVARLTARRETLALLLAGLTRLARVPPESLIARPEAPLDTVRTAVLLRAAMPAIEAEARSLRAELDALADTRLSLSIRRAQAEAQRAALNSEIAELGVLVRRREGLLAETEAQRRAVQQRLQALADEASDLRDLLARLEEDRRAIEEARRQEELARQRADAEARQRAALERHQAEEESRRQQELARQQAETDRQVEENRRRAELERLAAEARWLAEAEAQVMAESAAAATAQARRNRSVDGEMIARLSALPVFNGVIMPASGQIVLRYGQRDAFGETSRGLTLRPYPGAPVVAPLDGEVRFAGTFKAYGEILILEHSGGYHSLIAGFGRLDAHVGQQVLAGEPVGVTALPQSELTDTPTLYFEFRSNGQPVNPLQGLARARESERG